MIPDRILFANGESISSIYLIVGLPVNYKILSIWFKVDVPGKIAFPVINSPTIQPIDHMSTAFEYFVDPNSISGALYHLVATYSVKTGEP